MAHGASVQTIQWVGDHVVILDQTQLPLATVYRDLRTSADLIHAIQSMQIRGAPALGVAGAMGVALAAQQLPDDDPAAFTEQLGHMAEAIADARPTAVNLSWGVHEMLRRLAAHGCGTVQQQRQFLACEAQRMLQEDVAANRRLSDAGAVLLPQAGNVLTHCNAGALATAGYGTALGVIRSAVAAGKQIHVYADETRPLLQGARLTAWELVEDGIPTTLITDTMAGHFLRKGDIACVVVGADRIAANGDVANKVGTYGVAVLAKENGVPFYVAAPVSTIDLCLPNGDAIPIEERDASEVTTIGSTRVAPLGVEVANPAFDVTPARYVTAIITDAGVVYPPYEESLPKVIRSEQ